MMTIGKSRVVLAIVAIAFLLFNPAGICAGTPSSASPSHPCCPNPTPQKDAAPSSCICIDRQPAAPTLPSLTDAGPVVVALTAPVATLELPRPEAAAAFDVPIAAPQDRSVSFHQLLL